MSDKVRVQVIFELEPPLEHYPDEVDTPAKAAAFDINEIENGHGDASVIFDSNIISMKVLP